MSVRLQPQSNMFSGTIDFWLVSDGGFEGKERAIGQPVIMKKFEESGLAKAPTFSLRFSDAEELFERLWALGFRSKNDKGNAGALDAARKEHIEDLRKAAFRGK